MMPLPPHTFLELHSRELKGRYGPRVRETRAHDPDGFLGTYDALPPDPLFMAFRRLLTTGPIGALKARFERWIEARDDRRNGRSIAGSPGPAAPGGLPDASVAAIPDDDAVRPAAA